MIEQFKKVALASAIVLGVAACATNETQQAAAPVAEKAPVVAQQQEVNTVAELYEVHDHGRIYVFYDRGLYMDFLKSGHTPYVFSKIGEGPRGETITFGLTGKDKKKTSGIPSVELFAGNFKPAQPFYAEMRSEGRIYVFDQLEDMAAVRKVGEAAYRYTDILSGPNGETVVYVLNKSNKKKKPVELIKAFKAKNNLG